MLRQFEEILFQQWRSNMGNNAVIQRINTLNGEMQLNLNVSSHRKS